MLFGVRGMHTIQEVKVLGSAVQGKIEALHKVDAVRHWLKAV